jgi:hypothetical protein
MTTDEFIACVARIELRNPPFPIQIVARRMEYVVNSNGKDDVVGGVELTVAWEVPDRDTGLPQPVSTVQQFRARDIGHMDEKAVFEVIYRSVMNAFYHELQEMWHIDGVRVRDPHAKR